MTDLSSLGVRRSVLVRYTDPRTKNTRYTEHLVAYIAKKPSGARSRIEKITKRQPFEEVRTVTERMTPELKDSVRVVVFDAERGDPLVCVTHPDKFLARFQQENE